MDGFDVILLPEARHIDKFIINSDYPIVFSTETNVYLSFPGTYLN